VCKKFFVTISTPESVQKRHYIIILKVELAMDQVEDLQERN
jgi:hypothetical protein